MDFGVYTNINPGIYSGFNFIRVCKLEGGNSGGN